MSLEAAIQENTAAINNLLAFFKESGVRPGVTPADVTPVKESAPSAPAKLQKAASAALPPAEAQAETTAAQTDAVPSLDDVTKAALTLVKATNRDKLVSLLKEYGATKTSEVPEAKRAEFIAKAKTQAETKAAA